MCAVKENPDVLSMFGLNEKQTLILFSLEKLLVERDIESSDKKREEKREWLKEWITSILAFLTSAHKDEEVYLLTRKEVLNAIEQERLSGTNTTWYYLIMLESTLFIPYTPLGNNQEKDKQYSNLKYKEQANTLRELVRESGIMDQIFIDRFRKTYKKSLASLSGKTTKILLGGISIIAIAAVAAATAGTFAGPIAVALYGANFTMAGAALTSACLALAGGGAIAAGGAGMAGGILAIVGGGALLGLAGGGAVLGSLAFLVASTPKLALTQAAKLEVVLKEIIINAQKDIKNAQSLLENYKNQIARLTSYVTEMKLENEANKKAIANMETSIDYMMKAHKRTTKFVSSYEVGVANAEKENPEGNI